jgi:hypothetical protein
MFPHFDTADEKGIVVAEKGSDDDLSVMQHFETCNVVNLQALYFKLR